MYSSITVDIHVVRDELAKKWLFEETVRIGQDAVKKASVRLVNKAIDEMHKEICKLTELGKYTQEIPAEHFQAVLDKMIAEWKNHPTRVMEPFFQNYSIKVERDSLGQLSLSYNDWVVTGLMRKTPLGVILARYLNKRMTK